MPRARAISLSRLLPLALYKASRVALQGSVLRRTHTQREQETCSITPINEELDAASMTMTVAMRPSSESSSSPSKGGLRGPRPQPLKVSSSSRGSSPASKPSTSSRKAGAAPVIVYENTPKIVHARPQEFMTVVQRLTGKPANAPAATSSMLYAPASFSTAAAVEEGGDPLLLTLGQRQATQTAAPVLPSPMAAGMLMSPSFIFSPNTMQSIQDLSPLF